MIKTKSKTKSSTEHIKSAASKSLQDGGCVARPKQARAKKMTATQSARQCIAKERRAFAQQYEQ